MNTTGPRKQIAFWLLISCALVLIILVIGGITRLTQSGLSITQWEPIRGVIPPFTESDWQRYFDLYRESPEYQKLNQGMSLDEFKGIFWWEYIHRMVARLFGLVLVIPMTYFALRGWLRGADLWRALMLLVLVAMQAVLGWAMVQTGLGDRPYVSHHHLAAHLGLAFVLFGFMLWWALELLEVTRHRVSTSLRLASMAFAILVFLQCIWGGFVAGLDAGYLHNTFPLMSGHWVYPEVAASSPLWLDMTSNPHTVQFIHRVFGILVVVSAGALGIFCHRADLASPLSAVAALLVIVATLQLVLGVAILLFAIPVTLAVAHQAMGLVIFGLAILIVYLTGCRSR